MKKAILARKLGMTQVFTENGTVIPVTVLEAGPCKVVQKKSVEKELFPEAMDLNTRIKELEARNILELRYEYGTKWIVRIMILSRQESPISKPVRCVAGAGASPPEFINGPVKFRKVISSLESGNDMERLDARQELGPEFIPGEFDLDACNRSLTAGLLLKRRGPDR